jgi:hypothetical protein
LAQKNTHDGDGKETEGFHDAGSFRLVPKFVKANCGLRQTQMPLSALVGKSAFCFKHAERWKKPNANRLDIWVWHILI